MCGIVGYIGKRKAYPILIKGLHRLEYRGYDSAGVALINPQGQLNIYKAKGKVAELETYAADKDTDGGSGIAHTRWATHGEPNTVNAHPHYSESERLAIIHNGIIENYAVLKAGLQQEGYTFKSDTDTEVLVQLIEYTQLNRHVDLKTAVQLALQQVVGAYAIAVLDKDHPDTLVAARKGSPLVVGIGQDEYFLASDATPIVEYTDKVIYIEDEEVVTIKLSVESLELRESDELKEAGEPKEESNIDITTINNVQKTPEISGDTNRDNPVLISGVVNDLPDGDKELVIRMKMHPGFHVYGFVSDQDPYIATTFDIQTEGDWKKVGELQIPSFKNLGSTGTTIYEGDVMFRQRLKGSGKGKVTCTVNYQTCDEHACLPPRDVTLEFGL